jgi:hypothetical protein
MDSAVKFTTLELQNSITYDRTNTSAVDSNAPLSFLDWIKNFSGITSDPTFLLNQYKRYVERWFTVQKVSTNIKQDIIRELYISLFRTIAIDYLTAEEKRFIANFDLHNPSELAVVLPLLVSKIKTICLHYASIRERAKSAVYDYNIKGSEFSVKKIINEELTQSYLDSQINQMLLQAGVTQEVLKQTFNVSFEDYYDLGTDYFDINPALPVSAYNTTNGQTTAFAANSYPFDPNLFIDFNTSIIGAIEKYPVIIQELGTNFSINLTFTENDLQYLKDQDFTDLVNNLDTTNLNLNTLRDTLQQFSGTTFFYLSTNAASESTYGELFKADAFANYLNRRFPTVVPVEGSNIHVESNTGRFFRPDKLGILNFLGFNVHGTLQSLSADTLYVFPNPSIYGNISGLSRTKFVSPYSFNDDVYGLKFNQTNTFRFGEAVSDYFTKFKGYQSRSESLNWDATGPSRMQDPVEFFTGIQKFDWANKDIFPLDRDGKYPIDQRQYTLLNSNKSLFQHRADLFNNEYSLYKEIYRLDNPADIFADEQGPVLTCLVLDGHTFSDPVSGYSFNFDIVNSELGYSGVTLSASPLTGAFFDYFDVILPSVRIYPEYDFYKTVIQFTLTVYDGQNFLTSADYDTTDFGALIQTVSSTNIYMDSGPYLLNQEDASPLTYDRTFTVKNTILGDTLSSAETQLVSQVGTLSSDIPLYVQHNVYGDFYFRNYNSSQIEPASAALSGIYVKYNPDIQTQIFANTKYIDIVLNTLIVETENYMVFEKLEYDQNSYQFTTFPSDRNLITRGTELDFSLFSNTWFDRTSQIVYVACTNIVSTFSATNAKTLYFDLYSYDFEKIAPIVLNSSDTQFSLTTTNLLSTDIIAIERPILHYDNICDNYSLTYLLKDVSNMFYQFEARFRLNNYNQMYNLTQRVFAPDMFLHSENANTSAFTSILEIKSLSLSAGTITFTGTEYIIT